MLHEWDALAQTLNALLATLPVRSLPQERTGPYRGSRCLLRLQRRGVPGPCLLRQERAASTQRPGRHVWRVLPGTSLECCFLEVLAQTRIAAAQPWTVAAADLALFYAAIATVKQPLDLAYLADAGLARLGIDQRHTGGDDYGLSQRWSAAIQAHDHALDGIFSASRHHKGLYSVALFDRARGKVHFEVWGTLGDRGTPDLWVETARILRTYEIIVL